MPNVAIGSFEGGMNIMNARSNKNMPKHGPGLAHDISIDHRYNNYTFN